MFQLVIVIAMLDIEYPPKLEAFFKGFELATLSMPLQYNFVKRIVSEHTLARGETDERFQDYGFESVFFLVQEVLFYTLVVVMLIAFAIVLLVVVK